MACPHATLVLPTDFAPTLSCVSPDGNFVAARARDYGRVTLYRVTALSPRAAVAQLTHVAEVRGFADQVSWLEDSSAVLVGTDLEPSHSLANHDSTGAGRRIVIVNTDGRASSRRLPRTRLSITVRVSRRMGAGSRFPMNAACSRCFSCRATVLRCGAWRSPCKWPRAHWGSWGGTATASRCSGTTRLVVRRLRLPVLTASSAIGFPRRPATQS